MKTIYKILTGALCLFVTIVFPAQADYTLPQYQKLQLDNGITVYLLEQKEVPLIDATVVFNAGATLDNELQGLATLTTENMLFGAGELDKKAFEEKLEFVGAEFSTTTAFDFSRIEASFAKKDQQEILQLLASVILDPAFSEEEFKKHKTRYLSNLKRQKESPRRVIDNYFNQLVFEGHPYSNAIDGNTSSIAEITLTDVKNFYKRWFRPENAAIILVGDFDTDVMQKQLEARFGDWRASGAKPQRPEMPTLKPAQKARVMLVNKEDARESTFRIGGPGIARSNPDYVAISVINTVLGARFTSWLNDELRVNSGLTYGAGSRFVALKDSGKFYISTFTASETTEATLDLALKTYSRLWKQGIDAKTLESAKAYVKGRFPPRYETSAQLARLLADMFVYGFDENFINNFQNNVDKLNVETSKALIAKYFPQKHLQLAVIGKSADIKELLGKYGEIIEVEINTPGFSL